MIVSNFELLIKRIATVPNTIPENIRTAFRRVVQGYFLFVTNLEKRDVRFALKITIPNSSGNRIFDLGSPPNVQCVFDNGNIDSLPININEITSSHPDVRQYITGSSTLKPKQTGLIAVLPNVIPFIGVENPDLEIRGFIELVQNRGFIFGSVPEAKVLASPEARGTFLDNDYPASDPNNELDFDQLAYSLPTANGKTENTLPKLPRIVFEDIIVNPPILQNIELLLSTITKANPLLTAEEVQQVSNLLHNVKEGDELFELMKKSRSK